MHYVVKVEVIKVEATSTGQAWDSGIGRNVDVPGPRKLTEVAKFVVKGPELDDLVRRTGGHLALVQDDTAVQD